MANTSNDISLGPLEKQVLDIVWNQGEATVQDVRRAQSLQEKNLAYTTIMTILKRLTDKGVLDRHKEGRAYVYEPLRSKQSFLRNLVKQTIDNLVDRYGEPALAAFLEEAESLSEEERSRLLKQLETDE